MRNLLSRSPLAQLQHSTRKKDDSFNNITTKLDQIKNKLQKIRSFRSVSPQAKPESQKNQNRIITEATTCSNSMNISYKEIKQIENNIMEKLKIMEEAYQVASNNVSKMIEDSIVALKLVEKHIISQISNVRDQKLQRIEIDMTKLIEMTKAVKKKIKSKHSVKRESILNIQQLDKKICTILQINNLESQINQNRLKLKNCISDLHINFQKEVQSTIMAPESQKILQNSSLQQERTLEQTKHQKKKLIQEPENKTNLQNSFILKSLKSHRINLSQQHCSSSRDFLVLLSAQRDKYNQTKNQLRL